MWSLGLSSIVPPVSERLDGKVPRFTNLSIKESCWLTSSTRAKSQRQSSSKRAARRQMPQAVALLCNTMCDEPQLPVIYTFRLSSVGLLIKALRLMARVPCRPSTSRSAEPWMYPCFRHDLVSHIQNLTVGDPRLFHTLPKAGSRCGSRSVRSLLATATLFVQKDWGTGAVPLEREIIRAPDSYHH